MNKKPCVAFYGKIRIPTIGHKKAISEAKSFADSKGYDFHIGVSGRADPLASDQKKYFAESFFGQPIEESRDIIKFLSKLSEQHSDIHLFAGPDRAKEYRTLISKYNGKPDQKGNILFEFRTWKVHPVGKRRDIDTPVDKMTLNEKIVSVSASKLEQLVESNDYHGFKEYNPDVPEVYVKKLYNAIKSNLKEEIGLPAIGQTLSRDLMPQITGDSLQDFLRFLKKKDIGFKKETIDPATLKSTQSEFDTLKVTSLMYNDGSDPIIVSNDDHVMDGHHRWLADFNTNRNTTAYRVDLPVLELYRVSKEYCSKLNESLDHKKFSPMVDSFVSFASDKLGIKSLPQVTLQSDSDMKSFASYTPSDGSINLVTKNRHPMDIFRSLSHELVHHKQNEDGRITDAAKEGATGSPIEDEANSMAGRLMRWYAKANPDHFKLGGLAEATFVVGVPCSGKDVIIKQLIDEDTQEIDIMALFKASKLSESVVISSSAEDIKLIILAKNLLEENDYETKLIFVDIENGISKLRNEQREARGQRVLNESIRFTKYNKAKENMKTLKELFGNSMYVVENEQLDERRSPEEVSKRIKQRGLDRRLRVLPQSQKDKIDAKYQTAVALKSAMKMGSAVRSTPKAENPGGDPVKMVRKMTKKALGEPTEMKKKFRVVGKKKPLPQVSDNKTDDMASIDRIKKSKENFNNRNQQTAPKLDAQGHFDRYHKTGKWDHKEAMMAIAADPTMKRDPEHFKKLANKYNRISKGLDPEGNAIQKTIKKVKNALSTIKSNRDTKKQARQDRIASGRGKIRRFFREEEEVKKKVNTPSQREWGKKSLTKIYAEDTPGEDKKIEEGNPVPTADGPGPEYNVGRSPLNPFGTSIHESVKEWANKPETIERFKRRYGDKAEIKLNEAVKSLSKMTSIPKTTKTVTSIRENWDSLSGSDMGPVANASSKETTDETDGKMVVKKLRRKNNK